MTSGPLSVPAGRHLSGESPIHRCDARVKIGVGLCLAMVVFMSVRWPGLAVLGAGVLAATIVSRIPASRVWQSVKVLVPVLVVTLLAQALAVPGRVLVQVGPMALTAEGLWRGGLLAARLSILLWWGAVLVASTAPVDVTDALDWYLRPLRRMGVPAEDVALVMTVALRCIPVLFDQAERLVRAQKARGIELSGRSPVRLVRTVSSLIVPLFVLAFKYAEDVADAMVSRCYRGSLRRTRYRRSSFSGSDLAWLALGVAWLAVALVLGRVVLRGA